MGDPAGSRAGERASVLLITRNLPPLRGGMERLNQHMAAELARSFRVMAIGPIGCRGHLPTEIAVKEVSTRPLWRFLASALLGALRLAVTSRPRIVVAGSGLTAPFAVIAARLVGASSVVYAHGLDLVTQNAIYRAIWLPFVRRCDLCIVNSVNTQRLARDVGVSSERTRVIHPGVLLPVESGMEEAAADFRRRHEFSNRKLLLSVGRLTPRKGLFEFVRDTLPHIVAVHHDVVLVVIGDEAPDALNGVGVGSREKICACARELRLEENLRFLGTCTDLELAAAYFASDICVFPLRELSGDVEGFGMVAIEAAAHGLPTVAFDVGGVADAVANGQSGWLVKPGDCRAFARRIIDVLNTGHTPKMRAQCRVHAEEFEWPRFGAKLRSEMLALIDRSAGRPN